MVKSFRSEKSRRVRLTRKEKSKILDIDPLFKSISKSVYFDNYDLPCPVKVDVLTKDNNIKMVVLRKARHGFIKKEIRIIKLLKEFGLAVPDILCFPFRNEKGEDVAVYSLLRGENLQKLGMKSTKGLNEAKKLLIEAVINLMGATRFIKNSKFSKSFPDITLDYELKIVNNKNNPWFKEKIFKYSVKTLKPIIKKVKTPLVFSNGDYQPGNFLVENGKITGFLDFESPSFQDPLMGFVKYPIYDLYPLARTNIIELFLKKKGFSNRDFNIRLALGCLKILKKVIPVKGGDKDTQRYRKRVLKLLNISLRGI